MSGKHGTQIEWTHIPGFKGETWNPVVGCSKISPGCANCYAETIALRFGHTPLPWLPANAGVNVLLKPERLDQPRKWRAPRAVFVNSMSDLFHENVPPAFVGEVFRTMRDTPRHLYLILTKRPERMAEVLSMTPLVQELPLPNVWLGVSIENSRFTWRADVLREIPAALRFISAEPLLGSLFQLADGHGAGGDPRTGREAAELLPAASRSRNTRLQPERAPAATTWQGPSGSDAPEGGSADNARSAAPLDLTGIDWIIAGGESGGRGSRPMHPDWARELRDACLERRSDLQRELGRDENTAFFFKQYGSWGPGYDEDRPSGEFHRGAGNERRFVADCLCSEGTERIVYYGPSPKAGGKLLDGREWAEFPTPAPLERIAA